MTGIKPVPALSEEEWKRFVEQDKTPLTDDEKQFLRECLELFRNSMTVGGKQ